MVILAAILGAFIFATPLIGVHVHAQMFVEAADKSDDCAKPHSRPGSRAESTVGRAI
jgi:hypothetical protein